MIDGQVKIVDEQTGRIMEGRRYSDGLHQAIEAKERVKVEAATQTLSLIHISVRKASNVFGKREECSIMPNIPSAV